MPNSDTRKPAFFLVPDFRNSGRFSGNYQILFDKNPHPMWVFDPRTFAILAANEAARRVYGYSASRFLAMTIADLRPAEERADLRRRLRQKFRKSVAFVDRHRKENGQLITVELTWSRLKFRGKDAVLSAARDITQQQEAQQALQASEEQFRLLVEGVQDYSIILLDKEGYINSWNPGARRITGYEPAEILHRHFSCLYCPDDLENRAPRSALRAAREKGQFKTEGWRVRKDKSMFWASVLITALRGERGQLRGFVKITRDDTERRLMEREILNIASREQIRIGQDLHDSIGQVLTGIGFMVKALEEKLAARGAEEAAGATLVRDKVNLAIDKARRLSRGLYSAELEGNRLASALREMAADLQIMFGVECRVECLPGETVPDQGKSIQLYHIAQEAANNAVKHGKARQVLISIEKVRSCIVLKVKDDGGGIPAELPKGKGLGLRIMRYRAGIVNGTLSIDRTPEGGTCVTCTVHQD